VSPAFFACAKLASMDRKSSSAKRSCGAAECGRASSGATSFTMSRLALSPTKVRPFVHGWRAVLIARTGKLIFDGKYLRDLSFSYDPVGHLPSWINVVRFSKLAPADRSFACR
jgi:hypothetical protein